MTNHIYPVHNDSGHHLTFETQGSLPARLGLVTSAAYRSTVGGRMQMNVGVAAVDVSGAMAQYDFALAEAFPTTHDLCMAWPAGASDFSVIKYGGSYAIDAGNGRIFIESIGVSQTVTVGYISYGG